MSRHSRASSLRGRPWESFTEKGSVNDWGPINQVIYDARREPTDYCPRSLAGKPLAGFRATPIRRIPVLYGMVVYVIRFNNQLLHRQPTLRKRRLGENRGFRPSF